MAGSAIAVAHIAYLHDRAGPLYAARAAVGSLTRYSLLLKTVQQAKYLMLYRTTIRLYQ